jgi:hypothetical protein
MTDRHPPDPAGQCWHGVARQPEESVLYDEVYQETRRD